MTRGVNRLDDDLLLLQFINKYLAELNIKLDWEHRRSKTEKVFNGDGGIKDISASTNHKGMKPVKKTTIE